jgi:hypothetical protein
MNFARDMTKERGLNRRFFLYGNEASIFKGNKRLSYGSLLFLKFSSISSKSAHDIRVANIEYCSLNKICIHEV